MQLGLADRPALVAELQRLLPVLLHLGPQPPQRVLELSVLLPEAASLAGTVSAALRGARLARADPLLGRKCPGGRFQEAQRLSGRRGPCAPRWRLVSTQGRITIAQSRALVQELPTSLFKGFRLESWPDLALRKFNDAGEPRMWLKSKQVKPSACLMLPCHSAHQGPPHPHLCLLAPSPPAGEKP